MIHFLRNQRNQTIIECEVYNDDLSTGTNIGNYSMMLIDLHNKDLHYPFINDISQLDEIRGWWWERVKDSGKYKSIDDFVKEKFIEVAKKYDLNYVTD
jgi:hypothetical protein